MLDARGMLRRRAGARLWLSAGWLTLLCAVALLAPWIAPKDPLAQDLFLGRLPPFWVPGTEPGYWLGTDSLGRDVLSRIIHGARVAGRGRMGIMLREILPNVLPTIVVLLTLEMGIAVIVEAILSFVNLSISTDDPTWGGMISEGRTSVHQAWWVLVFPLVTLFLTVLSFSQLGEGLKDRFDPVLR